MFVSAGHVNSWDHLVPSIVDLASALIDSPPPTVVQSALSPLSANPDGSQPNARLPVAARLPLLGVRLLLEAFKIHPVVRVEVLETVCARMLMRGESVQHWVGFVQQLAATQPIELLEHTPLLKQLFEYVLSLPPAVATPLLRSLPPLQRKRAELRDALVPALPPLPGTRAGAGGHAGLRAIRRRERVA